MTVAAKLMVRTWNAVRRCAFENGWNAEDDELLWDIGPSKTMVATIHYETMRRQPEIGSRGLRDVVAWLAEDGLQMPGSPDDSGKKSQISQSRLQDAAGLLIRHGYVVVGPDGKPV